MSVNQVSSLFKASDSLGKNALSERSKEHLKKRYLLNVSFLESISNIKKEEISNVEDLYRLYLTKSQEIAKEFGDLDTQLNSISTNINPSPLIEDISKDLNNSTNSGSKIPGLASPKDNNFTASAFQNLNMNKSKLFENSSVDSSNSIPRSSSFQNRPFAPKIPSKLSGLIDNSALNVTSNSKEKRSREPDFSDNSSESIGADKRFR